MQEFMRFSARHFKPLSVGARKFLERDRLHCQTRRMLIDAMWSLRADDECDLILALITGDAGGEVTTAQLRGFLQGYSRGFLYDDPNQKRTMFPADCVTPAPQLELPKSCGTVGATAAHLSRDVVSQPPAGCPLPTAAAPALAPLLTLGACGVSDERRKQQMGARCAAAWPWW
jgi:hypothetical protein